MSEDIDRIVRGLTSGQREALLTWTDFEIGKWTLKSMGIFPARRGGKTVLGAAARARLEDGEAVG